MIGTGYEINRRLVFVMRLIGVGIHGIQLFCGLMDLGDSFNIKTYYDIVKHITTATRAVFDLVTRKAVKEEQRLNIEHELLEEVLTVSGDSSWAKRGFSSLVGIVSLIGKYSGKVIDTVVRSSYCKACEQWKNEKDTFDYECWYDIHKDECPANHEGSAGKMEVDGVVEMFMRSIEKFDVRYGYYIGDGDSKTFKMLLDTSPYGDSFEVKKLECVLHVKKRLYKRSAEAKKALTQKKKALAIDEKKKESSKPPIELSTYYGLAVLRNKDSIEDMRKKIWAGFYHEISTDKQPQHLHCPLGADSWCKYQKLKATNNLKGYKHPPALDEEAQEILKPIYNDLTKDELLQRCLGGHTQNNNESFNHCVWMMAPKHIFSGGVIVEIVTNIAACIFNEGFCTVLKIMDVLNLKIGVYSSTYAEKRDEQRIRLANRRSTDLSQKDRASRRDTRIEENQFYEESEGLLYGAGIAD
ncbi:hypothetical protein TKK_0000111 [Trichogramma kaykai]